MSDREDWGVTVAFLRKIRGWSQAELARAAGIHQSLVSLYERGLEMPTRKTLEKLAAGAGVPFPMVEEHYSFVRRVRARLADGRRTGPAPVTVDALLESLNGSLSRLLDEVVRPGATDLLARSGQPVEERNGGSN